MAPLRRIITTGALGAVLVAGVAAPAHALDVPPRPTEGAVQDQADLLTPDQEAQLNRLIGEKNSENEYIRAAVLTVDDTQGESIEDYSRKVATDWGKDADGIEHEIQYAPTFRSWLPLYVMYPAVYNGSAASSAGSSFGSSSPSSFGGGGGFTGGGASGSF
ncbi:hypothetical protein GKZ75_07555 [Kocuria indica]|uniref:TPM domain-containing protein n=2 Tax=Kocuria marina TaxID=223184 RepID=A0A6N9QXW5_9MICC|nr:MULTISPECIES: TPM domain-containing protein [Kocuria]NDO78086.1 hypothetical protein [Kocuria indica]